jgi:serine/threonine-protein kinase
MWCHIKEAGSGQTQIIIRFSHFEGVASVLRLRLFGTPSLERDGRPLGGAARQRRVLGLLAFVAAARERGVSRDSVLAALWSDSDSDKARQSLTQALYHARRAVGQDDLFLVATDLRLNPDALVSDVWEFADALARGDSARAVELYDAPFLDGFYVNDAPEFERWVADERARLAGRCADALEKLALGAEQAGDVRDAVRWRRRQAALDPLSSTVALQLMKALAAAGDRAGALQHARVHEALLRQELEVAPEPAVFDFVNRLRSASAVDPKPPQSFSAARPPLAHVEVAPITPVTAISSVNRPRLFGRRVIFVAATVAVTVAAVMAALRTTGVPAKTVAPPDLIAVAPFRVSGADPALAFLSEGLVDLLATKLTDAGTAAAADPASAIAAWRRAGGQADDGPSRDVALSFARQLQASRLLLGSVVGTPAHMVVSASLLTVDEGSVRAQASVEGPSDSLTALIDRLVTRLVAREAGISDRLANHTSTSLRALRAFLDGQTAYRRGAYRAALSYFRRALETDSTFAMAGLALAQAADRMNARADLARGLAAAFRHRGELVERDRIVLEALAGPRYPAASGERERLAAWERATTAMPERAEAWVGLGKQLFYYGRLLGIRDADERAAAAFRRARDLDDAFASPLQFLVQLAAARADSAALRRTEQQYLRLDSIGDLSGFVRWRAAVALGDAATLTSLRRTLATMSTLSLRAIALTTLYYGVDGSDAERAIAALRARTVREADRVDLLLAEHALALNRGQVNRALRIIDALDEAQPLSPLPERLRVLDALYGGSDSAIAERSAARIARRVNAATAANPSPGRLPRDMLDHSEDVCVAGQWSAWTGREQSALRAMAELRETGRASGDGMAESCAALVDAVLAVRAHAPDADARLARLDSVLLSCRSGGALAGYASLALARLYARQGNFGRAVTVARRRPQMDAWPTYLAPQLREQGRVAALAHDTATAVRAYRLYLALRTTPDSISQNDVEAARSALRRLIGGG